MMKLKPQALALLLFASIGSVNADPIDFIFGAGAFGRKAGTTADCRNLIRRFVENRRFFKDDSWRNRVVDERNPDFLNDLEYLDETRYANSTLGIVDTFFDKELDTQIYYTATAKPRADGTIPVVDPDAKALVVYLHGSGTMKASGVGFAGKMNPLAKMGYSSLSFDLPFHRLGSRNPALANAEDFAKYMDDIINKYRVPGQPVILVGHSFGPDIIAEYITRYPKGVDSAVLISPGSFDKVTQKWYEEKTSRMDFGDTEMNDAGGRWAGMVTNGKIWDKPGKPGRVDPTVANKDLDVYVISGDREEYVPGPLDERGHPTADPRTYDVKKVFEGYFSRVDVTIEPGVGHYIFNHKDAAGQDVVLRSVLRANGETLAQEKDLKRAVSERMAQRPPYDLMALRYQKEPFFRRYIDQLAAKENKSGLDLIQGLRQAEDKKASQQMLTDFLTVERQRVEALNANIQSTKDWAPEFYRENKQAIDDLGGKGDHTTVTAKYLAYLETLPRDVVAAHARVPASVFELPKKGQGLIAGGAPVTPEMKKTIMSDPELKGFVLSFQGPEKGEVIDAIGALKTQEPTLTNDQVIQRIRAAKSGN